MGRGRPNPSVTASRRWSTESARRLIPRRCASTPAYLCPPPPGSLLLVQIGWMASSFLSPTPRSNLASSGGPKSGGPLHSWWRAEQATGVVRARTHAGGVALGVKIIVVHHMNQPAIPINKNIANCKEVIPLEIYGRIPNSKLRGLISY